MEALIYVLLRLTRWLDRRPRPPLPAAKTSIRRILAISCTALGDTLLSTPALRALRNTYPHAHITLVANPALLPLFQGLHSVDELVPFNGRWSGFLSATLRLRGYDLAVILHGNEPQATPLAYLSGARYIYKLPNTSRWRFLLSNREPEVTWDELGHGIDQRLSVVRLAGAEGEFDRRMEVPTHPEGAALVASRLETLGWHDLPIIALQPGASTTSRRWPAGRFIELAVRLHQDRPDLRFVVTGSPAERPLCESIARAINGAGTPTGEVLAWASAGELPLIALPDLLRRARVLVSGDTGPMHLAVAVGTPVVALFAVSDPARSGPAYDLERHIVIRKWRTCEPCLGKSCQYREPPCMANISTTEVATAVTTILRHFS